MMLTEVLQASLSNLDDLKIDMPHCNAFFHSLLSNLLLAHGKDLSFNPGFMKRMCSAGGDGGTFVWDLLVGALRRTRRQGGQQAYKKALDIPAVSDALSKAKRCSKSALVRHLESEI